MNENSGSDTQIVSEIQTLVQPLAYLPKKKNPTIGSLATITMERIISWIDYVVDGMLCFIENTTVGGYKKSTMVQDFHKAECKKPY